MTIANLPRHRRLGRAVRRKWNWLRDRTARWAFRLGLSRWYVTKLRRLQPVTPGSRLTNRVFVDISVIAQSDARTGIQRVVRATAFFLRDRVWPVGSDVQFVYTHRDRHFVVRLVDDAYCHTDEEVQYRDGDVFLGLDFSLDSIWRMRRQLRRMRLRGVRFWFLVFDLLPLTNPEWFSRHNSLRFQNWIAIMAALADGFFCISAPVARQLKDTIDRKYGLFDAVRYVVVPMGADLASSQPTTGLPSGFAPLLARLSAHPMVLQVGTIEPRKGHADVLEAMQRLWAEGHDVHWVLVGSAGWKTAKLINRITHSPEWGRRLHWLGQVSDEALQSLYRASSGVICASYGEGFGLPVIEAMAHGKPVLVRDLEIFRVHGAKGVSFFPEDARGPDLAPVLRDWLAAGPPALTLAKDDLADWSDTADVIARSLLPARTTPE